MSLPAFRYHPDPLAPGSVIRSGAPPWERFLAALDKDGSPAAYVFRCIHCGEPGGYPDCD
ncbi:hypothetical protein P350_32710 [Burkholderia cepacia JBK9]|uniref:Uncharacterized protein n=1 Tax=Burkholderia arboris TaxID=488730 RepID=A0A9Q9UUX5_9BURK|nr:hypothetical protein [Burkholderia arboris]ALX16434.1 hypothetical protein P350_32710 [Burkholderia cepacia JBK9]MCA8489740.1 CbrC family protein [Burkholderia arboris]UTV60286.1 hypothetical protein NLX30_34445 [Burkholderia arboris]VWC43306.1 hypothetical protein BAR24066_07150 [Burkholderia arboris]